MRMTKFILTVCATMLIAMFANGIYILLGPGRSINARIPEPLSGGAGEMEPLGGGTGGDVGTAQTKESRQKEYEQKESSASELCPVNMLVLGLDKDETRSDVILLLNFDPEQAKLNILSIARDTRIISGGKYCKINALYAKGGEKLLAAKVTEMTGLPIHYYITINTRGFRKIIDTLGGVKFYVPFSMNYDDPTQNLHIHLRKGMQTLDGNKAEQLIRYRKGNKTGQGYNEGDIGRIKMQQEFIKALIKQKVNIRYLSRADEIFEILRKCVKTNVAFPDIAQYLESAVRVNANGINTFTLPGDSRYIDELWYFIYYRRKTKEMINSHFYK